VEGRIASPIAPALDIRGRQHLQRLLVPPHGSRRCAALPNRPPLLSPPKHGPKPAQRPVSLRMPQGPHVNRGTS